MSEYGKIIPKRRKQLIKWWVNGQVSLEYLQQFSIWNSPGPLKTGKPFQVFMIKLNSNLPWPYNHAILVTIELMNAIGTSHGLSSKHCHACCSNHFLAQKRRHRMGGISGGLWKGGLLWIFHSLYITSLADSHNPRGFKSADPLLWFSKSMTAPTWRSKSAQNFTSKPAAASQSNSFLIVPMDEFGPFVSKLGLVVIQQWCLIITACGTAFIISHVPLTHVCMLAWPC